MKVVLVNPIWTFENVLATNLAELAGFLRSRGFGDVSIVDLNFELRPVLDPHSIVSNAVDLVGRRNPDIVGISCNTIHLPFCAEFCREYKKRHNIPIVAGGIHPTFRADEVFGLAPVDYIVRGEGEETLSELLIALKEGRAVEGIPGVSFRGRRGIVHNQPRPLIKDLNCLPEAAYDLLLPYIRQIDNQKAGWHNGQPLSIYLSASRGCPYGCLFCSANRMWQYQRRKSPERFSKEISCFLGHTRERFINIADDTLTLNRDWCLRLMRQLKGLDIKWSCLTRIDTLDRSLIEKMSDAGCVSVYHGIESASGRLRALLDKKCSLSNKDIIKRLREEFSAGIRPECSFMTGIPTETAQELRATIRFARQIKDIGAAVQLWIMTPYPDIPAARHYKDRLISVDRWQRLRQADVYHKAQFYLYSAFYEKYRNQNPDRKMFRPNMPLKEFFGIFMEGFRGFMPAVSRADDYIRESPAGFSLVSAGRRLAAPYFIIKQPFDGMGRQAKEILARRQGRCLLSIRFTHRPLRYRAKKRLVSFLKFLVEHKVNVVFTRPLPEDVCRLAGYKEYLKAPFKCRFCREMFTVSPENRVRFCFGKELLHIKYAPDLEDMLYVFIHYAFKRGPGSGDCIYLPNKASRERILTRYREFLTGRQKTLIYLANRDFKRAAFSLKKMIRAGYDSWDIRYLLALTLKNSGRYNSFIADFQNARRLKANGFFTPAIFTNYVRKAGLGDHQL